MVLLQLVGHLMAQCIHTTSMFLIQEEDKYLVRYHPTVTQSSMGTGIKVVVVMWGNNRCMDLLEEVILSLPPPEIPQWDNQDFHIMVSIITILQEAVDLDLPITRLQIQTCDTHHLLPREEEVVRGILK